MDRANGAQHHRQLAVLQLTAPSRELAQQIFNREDWEYVAKEAAPIRRLFIKERRAVALQWLHHTSQLAALMINCYRLEAGSYYHPRKIGRFKLTIDYGLFRSLCATMFVLIRWGNPLHAAKMADLAITQVERFSQYLPPQLSGRVESNGRT